MELFGLLFAVPVTLVTSTVFCILAHFLFRRWVGLRHVAVIVSLMVAAYLAGEAFAVFFIGPFHLYQSLGSFYLTLHMVGFVFGPPAIGVLAYVTVASVIRFAPVPITVAIGACWFMCMFTLLANIAIDEDIFGVDGSGGRPEEELFPP